MKPLPLLCALLAFTARPALSQDPAAASSHTDSETVEVYTKALAALFGPPDSAGHFYIAARIRTEGARLRASETPEAIGAQLTQAGYSVDLAELAENGLWHVPRTALLVMLREIEWWPGRKIARFSIDVGTGAGPMREMAFKFLKEEGTGWVLIEKGPAENEG